VKRIAHYVKSFSYQLQAPYEIIKKENKDRESKNKA
jgi:hypothetical protein